MIPSISYPEATAKFRVITLQDQSKHTVKTLHKADTYHTYTSLDLVSVDRIAPEKELITTYNILTHVHAFLCVVQKLEQAVTGSEIKLIHTGPFRDLIAYMHVAGKAS